MTQILIFAYFSYELAELFEFSGVISLFVCALIMSHYCWYSISVNSRKSLFQIAGLLDYLSEILVFMSFGILLFTTGNFQKDKWNPIFIVIVICSILISRLASVLILTNGLNIFRKEKIPFKFQLVLWWCGMRGIVTLLLALSMDTPNRKLFLNTTYVVIFFTNIVIGLLTRPLVANLGVRSEVEGVNTLDPSATMSKISIDSVKKDKERSAFARWWFIIDNKYLKKIFGGRQRMLDDGKHKNAAAAAAAAGGGGSGDAAILGGDGDADDVIADITDDSPSTKRGRGGKGKGKGRRGTAADPARQSLNATGAATVAVISESDASDAEKLAGVPLLGGGGGDGSDSGSEEVFSSSSSSSSSSSVTPEGDDDDDDDDEKHEVIAPMSDTIRYMSAVDGGDGDNGRSHGHGHGRRRNHHHKQQQQHHHHYQYQHSLTLQQQKHTKSYGSFGTMVMGDDQYHQPTNVLDYSSSLIRSGPSSDNSGGGDVGGGGSTSSDDDGDNIVKMCSISPNENTSLLK